MNCPICGQPNACGIKAVQENNADCWCFNERFPEDLLLLIPKNNRGKACICKSCLIAYQDSAKRVDEA